MLIQGLIKSLRQYTWRILVCGPGPRLCASRRPVRRLLRAAYEFCRWISMPDGRWRAECSSYNSQITGNVENAVLSTRKYFSQLIVPLKKHRYNNPSCTYQTPSLDGFSSCVTVLALDFDTSFSWARLFSDFHDVCSSLAPTSSNFSSVSTRRLYFCFLSIKSPVVLSLFTNKPLYWDRHNLLTYLLTHSWRWALLEKLPIV
jgi:hypothetical protein